MKFRVGGVPENVNAPVYQGMASKWEPRGMSFQEFPGGTGAMSRALELGEIDIAIALTEGLVRSIAEGGDFRLVSMFTESPLTWGVHVAAGKNWSEEKLEDANFAISRLGSGSHLMAMVEAKARGWHEPACVVVQDLDGARLALSNGSADVFLWEKFTTKPLVDSGEWERIGEWVTPWPAFAIAVRNSVWDTHQAEIRSWIDELRDEVLGFEESPANHAWIAERFGLESEDVAEWMSGTRWSVSFGVKKSILDAVLGILKDAELVSSDAKAEALVVEGGLIP